MQDINKAINALANEWGITPEAVRDKYSRQLGISTGEFDGLLRRLSENEDEEIPWESILILLVLLIIFIILAVAVRRGRRRRSKSDAIQTNIQNLKCPQCKSVFQDDVNDPQIACTNCGYRANS